MDRRKEKRYFSHMGFDPVYQAWLEGQEDGDRGLPKRNRYPAGRRHDEYERGYQLSDPLGDWHGRNA